MPLHDSPCTWPQEDCVCKSEYLNFTPIERHINQHRFLQAITRLKVAFQDINALWENLEKEDQETLVIEYPFNDMLESIEDDIVTWQDAIIEGWKL